MRAVHCGAHRVAGRPPEANVSWRCTEPLLWAACLAGREPAESLSTLARRDLVAILSARGWTIIEIAVHCRMTTYTTARILAAVPIIERAA
jgi:hypothetical protein